MTNRILSKEITDAEDWASFAADRVIAAFPDEALYTCAAGISPSGVVHFGNFRDVMTIVPVGRALEAKGKKVRLLFSWDDFDRFRKVPKGMPEHLNMPLKEEVLEFTNEDFSEYLGTGVNDLPRHLKEEAVRAYEKWFMEEYKQYDGMPLCKIPDPLGELESYAERFEQEFEKAVETLGLNVEYRKQREFYPKGTYADGVIEALQKRELIAETLFGFMSEVGIEKRGLTKESYVAEYYPVSVYSEFTGKDATKVLSFDGESQLTYECLITKQTATVDVRSADNVKLQWKIDWPMRWRHENVHFEPGGKDHATPNGSYDVSAVLSEKIYGRPGPVFVGYDFIGISGIDGKMSSSAGNALSPADLLKIYTTELLLWVYERARPNKPFNLAFDSEIYRQYTELDREMNREDEFISFRQLVGYGQIVNWDEEKLMELLEKAGESYARESISSRLECAKNWLEIYNREEKIELVEGVQSDVYNELSDEMKASIGELVDYLSNNGTEDVDGMMKVLYTIPKEDPEAAEPSAEDKKRQREFFKAIYQLLFGKNKGPRLATYFWAIGVEEVLKRLDVK